MSQVRLYDGDVEGGEALEGVQVKTQYSKGYALSDNVWKRPGRLVEPPESNETLTVR